MNGRESKGANKKSRLPFELKLKLKPNGNSQFSFCFENDRCDWSDWEPIENVQLCCA